MKLKFLIVGLAGLLASFALGYSIVKKDPPSQLDTLPIAQPAPSIPKTQYEIQWSRLENFAYELEYPSGWHLAMISSPTFGSLTGYLDPEPIWLRDGTDVPSAAIIWENYRNVEGRSISEPLEKLKAWKEFKEISIYKTERVDVYEYHYKGWCGIDDEGMCSWKGYYVIIEQEEYKDLLIFDARREDGAIPAFDEWLKIMEHVALTVTSF